MNSLSWLLYLSEVADTLRVVFVLGIIFGGLGGLIFFGMWGGLLLNEGEQDRRTWRRMGARALVALLVTVLAVVFVPSRNTVLAIAASEVGGTLLATDQAKAVGGEAGALASDSLKLLHKYIDDQLANEAGK